MNAGRSHGVISRAERVAWIAAAVLASAIVAGPLFRVIVSVFQSSDGAWEHLVDTRLLGYARGTTVLAALVCLGAVALAIPSAWLVSRYRFPMSRLLSRAMLLPVAVPGYIAAYAYTDLFSVAGPVHRLLRERGLDAQLGWLVPDMRTMGGAALVLASTLFPYVFFAARVAFREQPAAAIESSRLLGAGPIATLLRVEIPLAAPAIAAGLLLVLMETVADFGTADYCAVDTFATGVYRTWLGLGSEIGAAQLATVVIAALLPIAWLESRWRRRRTTTDLACRLMCEPRATLGPWSGLAATAVCGLPLVLGFGIPVAHLTALALATESSGTGASVVDAAKHTLLVSCLAAGIAVTLAVVLAASRRFAAGRLSRSVAGIARFGYAVPGPVIAIGVISAATALSEALRAIGLGGVTKLLTIGSVTLLVLGYQTRFLGVAIAYIRAAHDRVHPGIDDAARTLGAGSLRLLLRLHLPMMRAGLLAGFIVLVADIAKELPITLMLRPFNFDTLAVRTYQLASDERLGEAACACLALIAFGVLPAALLGEYLARMLREPRQRGERI